MKVTILGMGYMGLPTALLLAKSGHQVTGFDIDKEKIRKLMQGEMPFEENGLSQLYAEAKKNYKATDRLEGSEVFIITVPTPHTPDNKCDFRYIISASEMVAKVLTEGSLVVLESTVTPGTTLNVVKPILDKTGKKYDLVYVSEKAIPGNTIREMENNHRIIGGVDSGSAQRAKDLYSSFVKSEIHLTDTKTAEIAKLMENTYRDVNIALANELSRLAYEFGINVWEAIALANLHPRVNIHLPGAGVGGHCIAIDPWFLTEGTQSAKLIPMARQINDEQPAFVVTKIKDMAPSGSIIALLGLAYKKNVDDDRESPSYEIKRLLEEEGYLVQTHDPYVAGAEKDLGKALTEADAVVIATGHDDYKTADFQGKKVLDCGNLGMSGIHLIGNGASGNHE